MNPNGSARTCPTNPVTRHDRQALGNFNGAMSSRSRQSRWREPVEFHRRAAVRSARELLNVSIRTSFMALLIAALLHAMLPMFNASLPLPALHYYSVAALMPNCMRLFAIIELLKSGKPRKILIAPARLSLNSNTIPVIAIERWRFSTLSGRTSFTTLTIRYRGIGAKKRTMTLGIGPQEDLLKIDRSIRTFARLRSIRQFRASRKARSSRVQRFTWPQAPATS